MQHGLDVPGDTPATIHSLELQYGLNSPQGLWGQYTTFWVHLVHGNLGVSTSYYPSTVTSVIRRGNYCAAGGARVIDRLLASGAGTLPRAIACANDQTVECAAVLEGSAVLGSAAVLECAAVLEGAAVPGSAAVLECAAFLEGAVLEGSGAAGARHAVARGGITRRAGRGAGRIATVHRSAPLRPWVPAGPVWPGPGRGQLTSR